MTDVLVFDFTRNTHCTTLIEKEHVSVVDKQFQQIIDETSCNSRFSQQTLESVNVSKKISRKKELKISPNRQIGVIVDESLLRIEAINALFISDFNFVSTSLDAVDPTDATNFKDDPDKYFCIPLKSQTPFIIRWVHSPFENLLAADFTNNLTQDSLNLRLNLLDVVICVIIDCVSFVETVRLSPDGVSFDQLGLYIQRMQSSLREDDSCPPKFKFSLAISQSDLSKAINSAQRKVCIIYIKLFVKLLFCVGEQSALVSLHFGHV